MVGIAERITQRGNVNAPFPNIIVLRNVLPNIERLFILSYLVSTSYQSYDHNDEISATRRLAHAMKKIISLT